MTLDSLWLLRLYLDDTDLTEKPFFDNDTLNHFLEGVGGDVHAAASEGWTVKAGSYFDWYLANIDGAFMSRDQVFKHCMDMADTHRSQGGIVSRTIDTGSNISSDSAEFVS